MYELSFWSRSFHSWRDTASPDGADAAGAGAAASFASAAERRFDKVVTSALRASSSLEEVSFEELAVVSPDRVDDLLLVAIVYFLVLNEGS